jgi:phage terminase large subunit-like protein
MNLHGAIIDELHAHKDRRLYDALTTASGSRRQPFTFIITTAGENPHSIAAEVHHYAEQVLEGVIEDPSFLPIIYAAPGDADWQDEAVWRAANPAIGSGFRSLQEMRTAALQARQIPGREQPFRQLYLNQWGTAGATRWLSMQAWDKCASAPPIVRRRAWLGVDLSANKDLTALVLVVPDGQGGYDVRADFWCPKEKLVERGRNDKVPYGLWVQQGYLHTMEGSTIDNEVVERRIVELCNEWDIREIDFDPWNARDSMSRLLRESLPVVKVEQTTANLSNATKTLETLILSGKIRHDGHPVLRWNISNAVAESDNNGNVRPSKKKSYERIDGVSALVTALSRAILDEGESIYASRGVLVL